MKNNIKYLLLGLIFILSFGIANADVDLWPLLETSKDGTTVLYPFYVNEQDFKMFFPIYYNTNKGKDTHILWPLLKFSNGRITRLAPIWFSGKEDEFTLFPFIRQTPDYTFWSIPPMYFNNEKDFSAVIPFYIKSPDRLFIFPNINIKNEKESNYFSVYPLYNYSCDSESKENNLGLLFHEDFKIKLFGYEKNFKDAKYNTTYEFFPWFEISKGKEGLYLNFLPFCMKGNANNCYNYFYLFPYYHSNTADNVTNTIIPLFSMSKSVDRKSSYWIAPFYYEKHEDGKDFTIYPIFYISKDGKDSSLVIFPLFAKMKEGEDSTLWILPYYRNIHMTGEDKTMTTVLFPFYSYISEKCVSRKITTNSFNLLWPLFQKRVEISETGKEISKYRRFIIFSDERTESGSRTFNILGIPIREKVK